MNWLQGSCAVFVLGILLGTSDEAPLWVIIVLCCYWWLSCDVLCVLHDWGLFGIVMATIFKWNVIHVLLIMKEIGRLIIVTFFYFCCTHMFTTLLSRVEIKVITTSWILMVPEQHKWRKKNILKLLRHIFGIEN